VIGPLDIAAGLQDATIALLTPGPFGTWNDLKVVVAEKSSGAVPVSLRGKLH
jgi:hypothetical protein